MDPEHRMPDDSLTSRRPALIDDPGEPQRLHDQREQIRQKVQIGRALDGADATTRQNRISLLARLIFAEAADHHLIPGAMEGIGWATINRVGAPTFPKTLEAVIHQPGQFDGVGKRLWRDAADPSKLTGPDATAYAKALEVAEGILAGKVPDGTKAAQFFYSSPTKDAPGTWFPPKIQDGELVHTLEEPLGKFWFLKPPTR
jgi:spore germination cell wall hydrolase CwlJ-like protein